MDKITPELRQAWTLGKEFKTVKGRRNIRQLKGSGNEFRKLQDILKIKFLIKKMIKIELDNFWHRRIKSKSAFV